MARPRTLSHGQLIISDEEFVLCPVSSEGDTGESSAGEWHGKICFAVFLLNPEFIIFSPKK